nr:site-specific integrase [Mesorhizobium sp. WSM4875]
MAQMADGQSRATSTPYLRKSPKGTFYLHWTEGRIGKRVTTGTADRATANMFLARWILLDQEQPLSPASVLTLGDVWAEYLEKHVRLRLESDASASEAWKNLKPHFGRLPADRFTQNEADNYLAKRTSGKLGRRVLQPTVRKELAYLAAAVKFCADPRRNFIPTGFAHKVTLPESSEPRDRWLRSDEIQKLFEAAERLRDGPRLSRGERFLWLALETGARKQAILDLTWARVDFELKTIRFAVPGRRQTKKRRATVPISDALLPVLRRMHTERLGGDTDLVMDNESDVWVAVQNAVIEAGLAEPRRSNRGRPLATGISPHVLRHTAATHMARRGVPLYIIAAILGNSVDMVAHVYGHHAVEDLRGAVNMISGGSETRASR